MLCKRRLLLIDESDATRKFLHQQLADLLPKLDIMTCASGQEAMVAIKRFGFEIICTPIRLPDMALDAFTSYIKTSRKNASTPVFAICEQEDNADCKAEGITATFSRADGFNSMLNYINRFQQQTNGCIINLLYVDASATSALITQSILDKNEIHFHTAEDGEEAFQLLTQNPDLLDAFDLMLVDHNTGEKFNGLELIAKIRSELEIGADDLPALLITIGEEDPEQFDFAKIFESGSNDFITKPLSEDDLIGKIHNLVHLKHQHQMMGGTV